MWEKKTGTLSGVNVCPGAATCSDPHDVNNVYAWSTGAPWNPDGSAFFSFLGALNGLGSFAGHSDWRLPTADELYSIVDGMRLNPAIDPVVGPTKPSVYWSSSTYQDDPGRAWSAFFAFGATTTSSKAFSSYVRAVRSAY